MADLSGAVVPWEALTPLQLQKVINELSSWDRPAQFDFVFSLGVSLRQVGLPGGSNESNTEEDNQGGSKTHSNWKLFK